MYALQRTTQKYHILKVLRNITRYKERASSSIVRVCSHVGLSVSTAQQGAVLSVTLHHKVWPFTQTPSLCFFQCFLHIAPQSESGGFYREEEVESLMCCIHWCVVWYQSKQATGTLLLLHTKSRGPCWEPERDRERNKGNIGGQKVAVLLYWHCTFKYIISGETDWLFNFSCLNLDGFCFFP